MIRYSTSAGRQNKNGGGLKCCSSLLLAAAAVALTSCTGSTDARIDAHSERVAKAVAQLDQLSEQVLERSGIPGMAVAVVHKGKTVYAKGFGHRRLGSPEPVTSETVFQLASVSKSVGATVVAHQVSKGVIAWDTPVVEYLPWFALNTMQASRAVTVGDLYAHRSGLPEQAGDDLEELGYGRRDILQRLRFLESAPLGSRYAYTNFGLTAAAEAVAVASRQEWETLSEETIYRPLGMKATSSRHADFLSRDNRAHPHILIDSVFKPGPQRQPDAQSPAGGVSSNVSDMARWMTLVLQSGRHRDEQLISPAALKPALEPQALIRPADSERADEYDGYGFNVSTTRAGYTMYSHSGAFLMGASTSFYLLPAAETGIVVLTNAVPVGAAEALCLSYLDLVQFGELTRDWVALLKEVVSDMLEPTGKLIGKAPPADARPALPLDAYAGTFGNEYFGVAQVSPHNGSLELIMGPASQTMPLKHWSDDVFVFEPKGEMAPPGSRSMVTFQVAPNGVARSLTIELYDETGHSTLTRH